ncbi:MAG: hypothetical protein ACHQJ6_05290 [Candidatus Berkiellales bacterium]
MIDLPEVPPYVYDEIKGHSLFQGDILKVDGQFRDSFRKFYPAINHPDDEDKYVLVLTQSCDLVKVGKRKPKLPHINVCLVRTIEKVIQKIIEDEIQPYSVASKKLLPSDSMDQFKDRLSKLLNNNDQKMHFFLPKKSPFEKDMIALLHMSFSFRTEEHYDVLLKNRVLSLKAEFQAKLGHIISQLYGRIATEDLSDWDEKLLRRHIKILLDNANLTQVPDKSYIEYINKNVEPNGGDIDKLIQEWQAIKLKDKFEPLKNELIQGIRNRLIKLFDTPEEVRHLESMEKKERSKKITELLKLID